MDEKINAYLNSVFALAEINESNLKARLQMKEQLTATAFSFVAEGLDEDAAVGRAIEMLESGKEMPVSVDKKLQMTAVAMPDAKKKKPISSTAIKIILLLAVGAAYALISAVVGANTRYYGKEWLYFLAILFVPLYAYYVYASSIRLKRYKRIRWTVWSPLIITSLVAAPLAVFVYYYVVFKGFTPLAFLLLALWTFAVSVTAAVCEAVIRKKVRLWQRLLLTASSAAVLYLCLYIFVPSVKLLWLIPVAATLVCGIILWGTAGKK